MITVGKRLALPILIGRGMTEVAARRTMRKAEVTGAQEAVLEGGRKHVPVTYSSGKFTIGPVA